jgi:hypothetical protein
VFPDDGLPKELVDEYDAFVRERAQQLISDVDDWLADAARRAVDDPTCRVNLGVSVYQYVAPNEQKIELEKQVITAS